MSDISDLYNGALALPEPNLLEARVQDNASSVGDEVRCKVPSIDPNTATDPMPWEPVVTELGTFYPKVGDRALLAFPNQGPPVIVWWEPKAEHPDHEASAGKEGPPGPEGAKGATGATGAKGETGATGATGATGTTGSKGETGAAGAAGAKWLEGAGIPEGSLGSVGDFYYRYPTWDIYTKTGASTWTFVINNRGAEGAKGETGATGSTGAKGETGAAGAKGETGATGATGAAGPSSGNLIAVRAATTAALSPTNTQSTNVLEATATGVGPVVDGVTLLAGNFILVKNEGEGKKNGVYEVTTAGAVGVKYKLTRVTSMNESSKVVPAMMFAVAEGTQNASVVFHLLTTGAITLNTTALTFGYATEWVAPTFVNSWENFGGAFAVAAYRKGGDNVVHLRGLVKHTASLSVASGMFTLPAGFRPTATLPFSVAPNLRVDVTSAGEVIYEPFATGAVSYLSLNTISFYAD